MEVDVSGPAAEFIRSDYRGRVWVWLKPVGAFCELEVSGRRPPDVGSFSELESNGISVLVADDVSPFGTRDVLAIRRRWSRERLTAYWDARSSWRDLITTLPWPVV